MSGERDVADQAGHVHQDQSASAAGEPVGVSLVKARLQHGASPADVADAIAKHPTDRDSILVYLHQTVGNGYVQQVVAALADPRGAAAGGAQLNATTDPAQSAQNAIQLVAIVESTLFPAYRRAVDALDAGAAMELACRVVDAMKAIEHGQKLVSTALSISHDALELRSLDGLLRGQVKLVEIELLTKIGPQFFRGAPILGALEVVHPGKSVTDYLAGEAGTMVELLSVIKQVDAIAGGTGKALTPAQGQAISTLVQPWHTRPVNFAFLAHVIREKGIWPEIANEDVFGKTLAKTEAQVGAQRRVTGSLADVGELDNDTLRGLLDDGEVDVFGNHVRSDDSRAGSIVEGLSKVPPASRGALVRQIHRAGRLDWFCNHVPRQALDTLNKSMIGFDTDAAVLLNPYIVDKGDGKSMRERCMEQVDRDAEHGDLLGAAEWFMAEQAHNALTFGFEREYSVAREAHEQGLTTKDEFESSATKALGKAAAIGIVSSLSGGAAGAFGEGIAEGIGASRSAAQIIAGGVGGVGAGVGGHLAGDVFDQAFNGKDGFDSVSSYMRSGTVGGIAGTVLAGVSVAAGKYLGESMRPIDTFATQHPRLGAAVERMRAAGMVVGRGAASVPAKIKLTVGELVDLIDSGLVTAHGGRVAGLVEDPGFRKLPADQQFEVSLRPMAMSAKDPKGSAQGGAADLTPEMIIDDLTPLEQKVDDLAHTEGAAYEDAKNGGRYAEDLEHYGKMRTGQLLRERGELARAIDNYEDWLTNPDRWKPFASSEQMLRVAARGMRSSRRHALIVRDLIDGVLRERNAL